MQPVLLVTESQLCARHGDFVNIVQRGMGTIIILLFRVRKQYEDASHSQQGAEAGFEPMTV